MSFFRVLLILIACAARSTAAPLTAELLTDDLRLRKDSPIPLEARLTNSTPTIIEGRLELTLLRGSAAAAVHRSGELVIQPGARVIALPLPPLPEAEEGDGLGAQIRFVQKDRTLDLGQQQIGVLGLGANELILAIPRTGRRLVDMDAARERSIRLETLRPALDKAPWLAINTVTAPISLEQMPRHPLGWCAYDAVLLDGSAFAALAEKQFAALARWVEGGGSVFVCPNDPPVRNSGPHHIAFLRRLAASQPASEFAAGENGRITSAAAAAGPHTIQCGLGRAVISLAEPRSRDDYKQENWRAAVAWLWKVSASHRRDVTVDGSLDVDWAARDEFNQPFEGSQIEWVWDAANGFSALTPGAPKQLPLAVVAGVLGLLLVLIGPGDWFVLGWLRRRRWTWFAFPVVCAGFAWWMAHLSGQYLGVSDRTGTVRLVDVGEDGSILREVRYELLFPASDREWTLDLRDAIAVPVPRPTARLVDGAPVNTLVSSARTPSSPAVSEWPSSGHFILRRSLRQWTPALVRVTAFPDGKDDSGIDWEGALKSSDSGAKGNAARLNDFSQGDWSGIDSKFAPQWVVDQFGVFPGQFVDGTKPTEASLMDAAFARRVRDSMKGLVFQMSPRTAGDLGDTRTFSPGEHRSLVAWRRDGTAIEIYRRHFREVRP